MEVVAARWLDLERAADLERSHATRLDVPTFPLSLTGDLDAGPDPVRTRRRRASDQERDMSASVLPDGQAVRRELK